MDKKEFGNRLRKFRKQTGLSQKDAADSIGIHNSTLSKYESGENEPDIQTMVKLSALYGVSINHLTGETSENARFPVDKMPIDNDRNQSHNIVHTDGLKGEAGAPPKMNFVFIPVYKNIQPGDHPFMEVKVIGYLPVDPSIIPVRDGSGYFAMQVPDNSMIEADIKQGWYVLFHSQSQIDSKDVGLVSVNGQAPLIRRVYLNGDYTILDDENPHGFPQTFPTSEVQIIGKLVSVTKVF